jgi:hypothetical protein
MERENRERNIPPDVVADETAERLLSAVGLAAWQV